jgi:hypothetical protein
LPQDQQVCDGAGACFDPACLTDGDCAACQTCVELTCSGRVEAREPCGDPGQFCDGEGSCVGCIDSDDCTPCNSCVDSVCTVTSEEGDACGDGGFCNAAGSCVACVEDAQCGSPCKSCIGNACLITIPAGDLCGDGLLCNDLGDCVQCISDLQCLNPAVEFCDLTIGVCVPREPEPDASSPGNARARSARATSPGARPSDPR